MITALSPESGDEGDRPGVLHDALAPDSVTMHLHAGWNLSSIPLLAGDSRLAVLFPSVAVHAFGYEGSYVKADSLSTGVGYWLKCDSAATRTIRGVSFPADTIPVVPGWNLIGSIAHAVPAGSVQSSPPGIVASRFFGYDGGSYFTADTIQPGAGYWVRVQSGGALVLPAPGDTVPCVPPPVTHAGDATFYTFADGTGSCMYDATPDDLMIGAMNQTDFAGSSICGACVSVAGPKGEIGIRIVSHCPECSPGDIDLSPLAFSGIADTSLGRVRITWHLRPCPVSGPIVYHFKDGSSQWWTAVQIRNHRYPVMSVEYRTQGGAYKTLGRTNYNYFVEPSGMGAGPYTFRVTDIFGHALTDSGIVLRANGSVAGLTQFPLCGLP
jgi:expansin